MRQSFDGLWPHGLSTISAPAFHRWTPKDLDTVFSPRLAENVVDLVRDRIVMPLHARIRLSVDTVLNSSDDFDETLLIWDLIDSTSLYTNRLIDTIVADERYKSTVTRSVGLHETSGVQFALRELVHVEQLITWVQIAAHQKLRHLVHCGREWLEVSREKIKACNRRLEARVDILLVSCPF